MTDITSAAASKTAITATNEQAAVGVSPTYNTRRADGRIRIKG